MKKLESNCNPAKKNWADPQIILISQNNVNTGVSPSYHEGSLVTSKIVGTAVYFTNGKTGIHNHTKNFYYS